nr:MAG TPA: hypothetical protein [Caudoviricetes sp.]
MLTTLPSCVLFCLALKNISLSSQTMIYVMKQSTATLGNITFNNEHIV